MKNNNFKIFPAIDLKEGECVRLINGNYQNKKVYNQNKPLEMVKLYFSSGLTNIHIVDLDGARGEGQKNAKIIEQICKEAQKHNAQIQLGGGIRNMQIADFWLDMGISNVIIGTAAIKDPDFLNLACQKHKNKISIGIDVKDNKIAISGWEDKTNIIDVDFIKHTANNLNLVSIIYTDISKDGLLAGTNLEKTKLIKQVSTNSIILSGGVSCLQDVLDAKNAGIDGAIIGRAIYENKISIKSLAEIS